MHPLDLFKQLLSEEKTHPDEFKNTLALLDEPTQKHYASVLEKGLHSIQLTSEEKNAITNRLKEKNYQIPDFNYQAYGELLFLTRLACGFEKNQDAELHAMKLIAMFGTTNQAIDYLVKFQNLKTRKQLIHDACLFEPPSDNLHYAIWQALAIKYMPNKEFETLLPYAHKIQEFVEKHRATYEKEIWEELVRKQELAFSIEYDQKEVTESEYIEAQTKMLAKKIGKEINEQLDDWSKQQLKISHQKLTPDDRKKINEQGRSEAGQIEKDKITKQVKAKYDEKFKKDFKDKSSNSIKAAEIKQQLEQLKSSTPPKIHYAESKSTGWRKTLEENFKTSAKKIYSKETDLETLLKYAANVSYVRSHENLEASKLFFSLGLSEESFNKYLELKPCDDPKEIPDVFIDGDTIGCPGFYIKKLPPTDPKAAVLGKLTSCCQSLGNEGEAPAIFGITDPKAGFYVLCQKKTMKSDKEDPIVSQCLAWRGQHEDMVFDSIESQVNFGDAHEPLIINMFMKLANHLVRECSVPMVLVGIRGETPDLLGKPIKYAEDPKNYSGYRDSYKQRVLASANLTILWQREFHENADTKITDTHIEEISLLWSVTGIVSKEIALKEIMEMGKHLNLSEKALNKQLDVFRMEYLFSSKEWTFEDRKDLLKYVRTSLNVYKYLVKEKHKHIFDKLMKEISHSDRLEFISTLNLTSLTPQEQKTLFFTTIATSDVASVKQLIEMGPVFKEDAKKAFSIATDVEVRRLLLSMDLAAMLNTSIEVKSDPRLFSPNPGKKAAIMALNEAFEKKLSGAKLNELTITYPMLKMPPLEEYFHKVKSLTPTGLFLGHIVRGEKEAAEAMLNAAENNPELLKALLCDSTQVTDYSGRTIEGTALQMAWGADDVSREAFPDEGMADMLMVHIRKLLGKDADMEITKQYDAQFPADYEQKEKDREKSDLEALNKVFAAVKDAKVEVKNYRTFPDETSQKALDEFRKYLAPKGVIKTGKHFNVSLLVEALKLYDEKFGDLGGKWSSPGNMLFFQQVIGSIQCLLPACYAQAFCQSLYDVVEGDGQKLERSLKFKYGGGLFFPLNSDPSYRLGVDYAVPVRGSVDSSSNAAVSVWGSGSSSVAKLIEQKQKHTRALRRAGPEAATSLSLGRSSA